MKILFISNYPSPYRVDFWNLWGKSDDLIVTFEKTPEKQKERCGEWKKWFNIQYTNFKAIFLNNPVQIVSLIKQHIFDHIIVGGYTNPSGMIAIQYLKLSKKAFWIEADGGIIRPDNFFKFNLKKYFISSADGWLSSGKQTTEYFIHYGAKATRIKEYRFSSLREKDILPKVISKTEKYYYRKKIGIKNDKKIVLAVGQFIYRKGFDILINAISDYGKLCELYLVGGEPTDEYMQLVRRSGINNVHFVGFKSKSELLDWYRAADIFVHPTREDIWGLVINEAMANGLPIVTTENCIAGLELVSNGVNGFIVNVDDTKQMQERIVYLLQNEDKQMEFGKRSLECIRHYTIETMVQDHITIMKQANYDRKDV